MTPCKRCGNQTIVKNGRVRGQQRYRCKACGFNFIEGDLRVDDTLVIKKALAVILYSVAKASFGMLGHIFGVSRSLAYRWIKAEAERLPEPEVPGDIRDAYSGESCHSIQGKAAT